MKRATRRPRRRVAVVLTVLVATSFALSAAHARAEPLEVHQVEAEPQQYLGTPIEMTGRFLSSGAGRLQLVDSEIDCLLTGTAAVVRPGTTHVALRGTLERQGGRLVFRADRVGAIGDEEAQFAERRARIQPGDAHNLYRLSRWIRARAAWYRDPVLYRLAWSSYREAFAWEEEALAHIGDGQALIELADRGSHLGLEPAEAVRIRHRACWLDLARLVAHDAAGRRRLAEDIAQRLPGTEAPRDDLSPELVAAYRDAPLETYAAQSHAGREALHRALWVELIAAAIDWEARTPGADLSALAAEAQQRVPERGELVRDLRQRAARQAAQHPAALERRELLALRDELEDLNLADEARALVVAWLDDARRRLPAGDADGRVALANQFVQWLGDTQTATSLYQEALAIAPQLPEAAEALRRLGYVRLAEGWRPAAEMTPSSLGSVESYAVRPGDTREKVEQKLRRPDSVSRVAAQGRVIEQWRYEGPPALVVTFRLKSGGEAAVTAVDAP